MVTLTDATDGILGDASAEATILDDDTAGTAVAPTTLETSEPSGTEIFTITLDSQPVAPVLVTLNNSDANECSVPANVTLNESNWQNGIGVTVQAVDDFVVDGTQSCTIDLTAGSGDPLYDGIAFTSVQVAVQSDDVAGIEVTPANPVIGEANLTGYFTVTLTSEPTATVTIAMTADDGSECSIGNQITLDAGNWQAGVPVPVTTIDDEFDDGDQTCTIQNIVTSSDPTITVAHWPKFP